MAEHTLDIARETSVQEIVETVGNPDTSTGGGTSVLDRLTRLENLVNNLVNSGSSVIKSIQSGTIDYSVSGGSNYPYKLYCDRTLNPVVPEKCMILLDGTSYSWSEGNTTSSNSSSGTRLNYGITSATNIRFSVPNYFDDDTTTKYKVSIQGNYQIIEFY